MMDFTPEHIKMREPARNDHQVHRTIAQHLISNVPFRAFRVARLRLPNHRREYPTPIDPMPHNDSESARRFYDPFPNVGRESQPRYSVRRNSCRRV
jgi:hypothetical protein